MSSTRNHHYFISYLGLLTEASAQ